MAPRVEDVRASASPVPGGPQGLLSLRCRCCMSAFEDKASEERRDRRITGNQSGCGEPLERFLLQEGEGPLARLEGGPGSLEMSVDSQSLGRPEAWGRCSSPAQWKQKKRGAGLLLGKVAERKLAHLAPIWLSSPGRSS